MARALGVIGVPSSAGAYAPGQEQAPRALRDAGLLTGLTAAGVTVVDHGDAPVWRWRPDRDQPYAQNLAAVVACASDTAERVRSALAAGEVALVLGGDCTVGLGTVAGSVPESGRVGLVYLDVHGDLNTPDSVPDGALDWMGVAHMLGSRTRRASCESSARACRCSTTIRSCARARHAAQHAPRDRGDRPPWPRARVQGRVAADPVAGAPTALSALGACERLAVHFDVDCIDFTEPRCRRTGTQHRPHQDDAFAALAEVLLDPRVGALTIAELNPSTAAKTDRPSTASAIGSWPRSPGLPGLASSPAH